MTVDHIETLMRVINWTGLVFSLALLPGKLRAVPGSYERFRIITMMIIARSLVVISCIGWSILSAIEGEYFLSGMWAITAIVWIDLLINCFDDDNWFKKQFNRLKKGIKKLRSIRIHIRKPTFANPLPAPALAPVLVR